MSLKNEISVLLSDIADMLEFNGDNPFKISAYRNGANAVESLPADIAPMIVDGTIKNVKGIGKGILAVITEYYNTGISEEYNRLKSGIPEGLTELLRIRGLGARKIKQIYDILGVKNLEDFEKACLENKLAGLKGFGEKTQEKLLQEIRRVKAATGYVLLSEADVIAYDLQSRLSNLGSVKKLSFSGEYRRSCEIIKDLLFIVLTDDTSRLESELDGAGLLDKDAGNCIMPEYLTHYNISGCVILAEGLLSASLFICKDAESFAKVLFLTTGSQEFTERRSAEVSSTKNISDEKELFGTEEYVIPEMREEGYYSLPAPKRKNSQLEFSQFRGFMHFHTVYSDGRNTVAEMVQAAVSHGFEYCVVCDHSKSAFYAQGLTEDMLLRQAEEIRKTAEEHGLTIYQGIESDILADGSLDYSNDVLSSLKLVVASVHSRFNMDEDEMTARIIKAVENPHTDILGHPTGRLLLARDPYKLNIKKVIDACAANSVAIEINAHPRRLDLDWRNIYYAREKGCMFAINPDAHTTDGILDTLYGIRIARKGGIQPGEVINCFSLPDFIKFQCRKIKRF